MSNQSILVDTYCLYTEDFVGVKTKFSNTLAQSIYGFEVLIGDKEYTNLFKLDCQLYYEYLAVEWKKQRWTMFNNISHKLPHIDPKSKSFNLNNHKAEIFEALAIRKIESFERRTKFKVVFATGSRKNKQLFAVQVLPLWTDYLGSKAISHGNNLMSNNQGQAQRLKLNCLIVDDNDVERMNLYGLADCHGAIKSEWAKVLGAELTKNPFQFRAFAHGQNAIFKGVLRPVHKAFDAYQDMGEYSIILPTSCFKYDKTLSNIKPGVHALDATLIVHKAARASWSGLGLTLQYFKDEKSVEELKAIALDNLTKLNAYVKNGKLDPRAILGMIDEYDEADELDDDNLDTLTTYQNTAKVIRSDVYGLLHDHPYVVDHVIKWYASQIKSVAITAGIKQRYLLACPMNELEGMGNIIIVNDKKLSDTKGLLVRFPARNSNDVQPTTIINIAQVWQQFDEWCTANTSAGVNERKQYLGALIHQYLEVIGLDAEQSAIISIAIRQYGIHRFDNCFWISPSLWASYGGDFDGDYGNVIERSTMPQCYDEATKWGRYPEAIKPSKTPMTGSVIEQAVKSFSNDIGLLSNFATVMNTTMEESRYTIQAPLVSQQMTIAVDAYKTMTQVDEALKSDWLDYYIVHSKGHWVREYKKPEYYTEPNAILPESDDTIGQLIAVVNTHFNALNIKPCQLDAFKDLLPISYADYHYHSPKWGMLEDKYGIVQKDKKGNPIKVTLYHKVGQFYGRYAEELKGLSTYYSNGAVCNYYEDESGDFVYLSDERKAEIRKQRRSVIDKFKTEWDLLINGTPDKFKPVLEAALWNVAHSRTSNGAASLCFYLISDEICQNLSRPRTVSMKLVTDAPELLDGAVIKGDRIYQLHVGEMLDAINNPRLVSMDGYTIGKVYPSNQQKFGNGFNFSRLIVSGDLMVALHFVKNYTSGNGVVMAEYEVIVDLTTQSMVSNQVNTVDDSVAA